MVTAWSPSGLLRARSSAGPLRLLWLAALLLSVAFTHGVHAESAEGHAMPGATASAHVSIGMEKGHTGGAGHTDDDAYPSPDVAAADDRHDGDGSSHPAQTCMSGQPQQGMNLAAPCLAPLDWAQHTHAYASGKSGPSRPESALPSSAGSRDSIVQQV